MQVRFFPTVAFVSLILTQPATAENAYILFEVGEMQADIHPEYVVEVADAGRQDFGVASVGIGWRFDSNIELLAAVTMAQNFSLFGAVDTYDLDEASFSIGYGIDLNERFRLIPSVGMSSWTLKSEEGAFLNPGREDQFEISGTDAFGLVRGEVDISDSFGISMALGQTNYEFGDVRNIRVGFRWLL